MSKTESTYRHRDGVESLKAEKIKVLVLEDNPADVRLIQIELEDGDYDAEIRAVDNEMDYVQALSEELPDVILADVNLPSFDGMEALAIARMDYDDIPFIVVSGFLGEEATVEVIKNGATDFVSKNNLSRLNYSIYRALMEYVDRKKRIDAERDLILSEERYRLLAENMLDMVCLQEPQGNYIWLSPSSKQLIGFEPNELIGKNPNEFFHPDDRQMILDESHKLALKGEKSGPIEYRFRKKDGTYLWLETVTKPIFNSLGALSNLQTVSRDVTERKEVELREQQNRELFEALFSKSADGIFLVDCETNRTIDCNEQVVKMFEAESKEELIGIEGVTLQKEPFSEDEVNVAIKLLDSGRVYSKQLQYITKKRRTFWGHLAIVRIEVLGKRLDVARVTDVSERIKLQEEFDQFFNLSNDMFSIADASGHFVQLNPAWENIMGYTADELYRIPIMDLIHVEDKDKTKAALEHLRKREAIEYFENRVLTKQGETKYLVWSAVVLKDSKMTYSVCRDITGQKLAAIELEKNRDFLKQTQAMALIGSYEIDLVNNDLYWSDEVYRIFNVDKESYEPEFDTFLDMIYPADRKRVEKGFQKIKDGTESYDFECRVVRADSVVRILHAKGQIKFNEQGTPVSLLGTCQDITDRKRIEQRISKINVELEERVKQRTTELRAANKELEAFNFTISHELRMPLRAAEIFAEQLEKKYAGQLDKEGSEYVYSMVKCVNEMGQLIHDVLAFSKVGKLEQRNESIQMKNVVKTIISEMLAFQDADNIHIQVNEMHPVLADRNMMKQVWLNLLGNAIKYSKSKKEVHIEVGSKQEGEEICFYVKDNGVGFNEKDRDKLFQAFERLHSGEEFEGSGVGLAIVERIISRHGGRVWAESKLNEGATFSFSLPVNGANLDEDS